MIPDEQIWAAVEEIKRDAISAAGRIMLEREVLTVLKHGRARRRPPLVVQPKPNESQETQTPPPGLVRWLAPLIARRVFL